MDVGILLFIIVVFYVEWNLLFEEMKWIGSVNFIGMVVGVFLFGLLVDWIGCKKVFIIIFLCFFIGSGIFVFVMSLLVFFILCFVIGMGLGGEFLVVLIFVLEVVVFEKWGRVIVFLESFWVVGWFVVVLIFYFVILSFGWQVVLLLIVLIVFYVLYLWMSLFDLLKYELFFVKKKIVWENVKSVWVRQYIWLIVMLLIVWFCVVFFYYGMFLWLLSVMLLKGFSMI